MDFKAQLNFSINPNFSLLKMDYSYNYQFLLWFLSVFLNIEVYKVFFFSLEKRPRLKSPPHNK